MQPNKIKQLIPQKMSSSGFSDILPSNMCFYRLILNKEIRSFSFYTFWVAVVSPLTIQGSTSSYTRVIMAIVFWSRMVVRLINVNIFVKSKKIHLWQEYKQLMDFTVHKTKKRSKGCFLKVIRMDVFKAATRCSHSLAQGSSDFCLFINRIPK